MDFTDVTLVSEDTYQRLDWCDPDEHDDHDDLDDHDDHDDHNDYVDHDRHDHHDEHGDHPIITMMMNLGWGII